MWAPGRLATLREWREQFVAAGRTALASTPVPSRSTRRLHHVGIIVPSEHRIGQLMGILGLEEWYRGEVPQWQATCVFARVGHGLAVEFVLPNGGVLSQFNQAQGGLHHFALAVDNLAQTTEELESKGVSLLERAPHPARSWTVHLQLHSPDLHERCASRAGGDVDLSPLGNTCPNYFGRPAIMGTPLGLTH